MSPAPPLSGVKCLLLLLVMMTSSSHCLSSNTTIHYSVHPDNSSTHLCPALSTCLTINEYAPIINNTKFLQNAEIVLTFLPGEHVLSDSDIQLSHIDSFTMTSRDGNAVTSLIIRESRIEIYGINAVSINQLSLTVIQTIIPQSFPPDIDTYAIVLESYQNIEITNCTVQDSNSNGLCFAGNGGNVAIMNTMILSNHFLLFIEVLNATVEILGNTFWNSTYSSTMINTENCNTNISDNTLISNRHQSNNPKHFDYFVGSNGCGYSIVTVRCETTFQRNIVTNNIGGFLYSDFSYIAFEDVMNISSNRACHGQLNLYGDVHYIPTLKISGTTMFTNNSATQSGGAMYLFADVVVSVQSNASLVFMDNSAANSGGAIHIDEGSDCQQISFAFDLGDIPPRPSTSPACFLNVQTQDQSNFLVLFQNNSAFTGDDIFYEPGLPPLCRIEDIYNNSNIHIQQNTMSSTSITSSPKQVCLCNSRNIICCPRDNDFVSRCLNESVVGPLYPGQNVTLQLVAVGSALGITPAFIRVTETQNAENVLLDLAPRPKETVTPIDAACTAVTYSWLPGSDFNEEIYLYPAGICDLSAALTVRVNFHTSCPPGFMLSDQARRCECEERLLISGISCDIGQETIQHTGNVWLGYSNQSGLILHSSPCPFDYCTAGQQVTFSLNNTDAQCRYNRSGLLCGRCSEGLSTVFGGTSQCRECSNTHLALLFPFAVAGIALVAFLFLLRFTVSYGTLNGLIFYANVVQVYRTIFLPAGQTNILTVFIAWLNLDLGIETCFYNGMDAYSQTWLQFVFPFYILGLTTLIIFISSHSRRVTQALGSNPVAVLTTLFLLSYLKVFRIITVTFLPTILEYPGSKKHTVWQLDGNLSFDSAKHIVLSVFAIIIFVTAVIPYTIFLLFSQLLLSVSHLKFLSWMNNPKVKALLDTYHAPYKASHRYWTGLFLVLRILLAIVAALTNISTSFTDRQFGIASSTVGVVFLCLVWSFVVQGVYKNRALGVLECSFLVNLGLLAFASYHIQTNEKNLALSAYTSIGIAFAEFIGIVIYHSYIVLSQTRLGTSVVQKVKVGLTKMMHKITHKMKETPDEEKGSSVNANGLHAHVTSPTHTVVDPVRRATVWRYEEDDTQL